MLRAYTRGDEPVPGFRLVEHLGRGGFGEVWKVTAPGKTDAALKIISLVNKQGYKEYRAIRLVKNIKHPNLTPIIAFWLKDDHGNFFNDEDVVNSRQWSGVPSELLIAMGLGDRNLFDVLKACQAGGQPGIPAENLLDYIEDAARAIDHLNQPTHDLGAGPVALQHCDIKPQNLLLVGGAVQVCDFGLVRVLHDNQASQVDGSVLYMAPELINENRPSQSSDQYSLAITYYQLRCGVLPFDAKSTAAAFLAHTKGKLEFSLVSEAERVILRKATAMKPAERFPKTVEMVRALRSKIAAPAKPAAAPSRPFAVEAGRDIVPGYRLNRLLGKGGYGEVWQATAPGGKAVAIKVIRDLGSVKGRQEFRALELIKSVSHNHLVELHAFWLLDRAGNVIPDELRTKPDAPEAAMLVIATTLASKNLLERLQECQDLGLAGIPTDELLRYMRQAASAIDFLNEPRHQLGNRTVSIQHRDIKPENILLAADTVKVGDFGLAKVLEGTLALIHADSSGLTMAYSAPEFFGGQVARWSDQYSLALTYFKLRTGRFPFDMKEPTFRQYVEIHTKGCLDLALLPKNERRVVERACSIKPSDRYPTCLDMIEALETAAEVDPNQPPRPVGLSASAQKATAPTDLSPDDPRSRRGSPTTREDRDPSPSRREPPRSQPTDRGDGTSRPDDRRDDRRDHRPSSVPARTSAPADDRRADPPPVRPEVPIRGVPSGLPADDSLRVGRVTDFTDSPSADDDYDSLKPNLVQQKSVPDMSLRDAGSGPAGRAPSPAPAGKPAEPDDPFATAKGNVPIVSRPPATTPPPPPPPIPAQSRTSRADDAGEEPPTRKSTFHVMSHPGSAPPPPAGTSPPPTTPSGPVFSPSSKKTGSGSTKSVTPEVIQDRRDRMDGDQPTFIGPKSVPPGAAGPSLGSGRSPAVPGHLSSGPVPVPSSAAPGRPSDLKPPARGDSRHGASSWDMAIEPTSPPTRSGAPLPSGSREAVRQPGPGGTSRPSSIGPVPPTSRGSGAQSGLFSYHGGAEGRDEPPPEPDEDVFTPVPPPRRRPIGLLIAGALVVAMLLGGGTAVIVFLVTGPGTRSGVDVKAVQAEVEALIKARKFEDAVALVDAKVRAGSADHAALRESVRAPWVQFARRLKEDGDASGAEATCRRILQAFPDDREATALLTPAATAPPTRAVDAVVEGEQHLRNGQAEKAAGSFAAAREMKDIDDTPGLRQRAVIGEARATARRPNPAWSRVRELLRDKCLAETELPDPVKRSLAGVRPLLLSLADEADTPATTETAPARFDTVLGLYKPTDVTSAFDSWEQTQVTTLKGRLIGLLLDGVRQAPPDRMIETARKVLAAEPGHRPAKVRLGEGLYRSREFAEAKQTLDGLGGLDDDLAAQRDALLALIAVHGPDATAAERGAAMKTFADLLRRTPPGPWPGELASAVVLLAEKDEQYTDEACETLRQYTSTLPDGPERSALEGKLKGFEGKRYRTLLARAESELAGKRFADCQRTLEKAQQAAPDDSSRRLVDTLLLVVALRDPARPADARMTAFRKATEHLRGPSTPPIVRVADLCLAVAEVGAEAGNDDLADEAARALADALARQSFPSPADKARVRDRYQSLVGRKLVKRIQFPDPDTKPEAWDRLREDCEQAGDAASGWVIAARAESLFEHHPDGAILPSELDAARKLAQQAEAGGDAGPYVNYVRARVLHAEKKRVKAAELLLDTAFADPAMVPPYLKSFRARRSRAILAAAAAAARAPEGAGILTAFPTPADADLAYRSLAAVPAVTPGEPLTQAERVNRALAGVFKPKPDPAALRELTGGQGYDAVATSRDPAVVAALPLINLADARAQPNTLNGHYVAVKRYVALLDNLQKSMRADPPAPLGFLTEVLDPALAMIDAALKKTDDDEFKSAEAKVQAARGRLLLASPLTKWPFRDPANEAWKAFDRAARLDESQPEYLIGRGLARSRMKSFVPATDLDAVRDDAEAAVKVSGDSAAPGAAALRVLVPLLQAAEQGGDDRLAAAQAAIKEHAAERDRWRKSDSLDDLVVTIMLRRSELAVRLARGLAAEAQPGLVKQLVDLAAVDANRAVAVPRRQEPALAFNAAGEAEETAARFTDRKARYSQAITAYDKAVETNPTWGRPLINRARCRFYGATDDQRGEKWLRRARADLEAASKLDLTPAERDEVKELLGKVSQGG